MSVRAAGVHLVPIAVAPLLLGGIALDADAGWAWALLVLVGVGAWLRRLEPGLVRARETSLAEPGPAVGAGTGLALSGVGLLAATGLVASLLVALADLLIEYAAALWGLPVLALAIVVRVRGRAGAAVLAALGIAVAVAGALGDRFEAAGGRAHGWAHSGPIAGVHPFQSTAVTIDGHGPFDIPINDYVEPDGSRGYGPEALAQMLERTLHALARTHFADGPARAHKAFAHARVELGELPQLHHPELNPISIGVQVWSGTHGPGSRVEFVCPGQVEDPRGRRRDAVMRDSCPDKYASEASAGLGLTGRWPGYTEGRGNPRLGLAQALGATRSEDEAGRRVRAFERMGWVVLLALALGVLARRRDAALQLATVAGASASLALGVGFVAMVLFVSAPSVPVLASAVPGSSSLVPALAAVTGLAGLAAFASGERVDDGSWIAAVVGLLALGTAWVASSGTWAAELAHVRAPAQLVGVLADAASRASGLDVQALEGSIAAVLVAVSVGALVLLMGPIARTCAELGLGPRSRRWPTVAVGAVGALLAVTAPGDRTIMVGSLGLAALTASAVSIVARRGRRGLALDRAVHVVLVGLGGLAAIASVRYDAVSAATVWALGLGGLMALATLGPVLARPR